MVLGVGGLKERLTVCQCHKLYDHKLDESKTRKVCGQSGEFYSTFCDSVHRVHTQRKKGDTTGGSFFYLPFCKGIHRVCACSKMEDATHNSLIQSLSQRHSQ